MTLHKFPKIVKLFFLFAGLTLVILAFFMKYSEQETGKYAIYSRLLRQYPTKVSLDKPGRYIRIQISGKSRLSITEVEIFGNERNNKIPPSKITNLALYKATKQSSTIPGGKSDKAVDGEWSAHSISSTKEEAQAWWEVDLGDVYDLKYLVVWDRNTDRWMPLMMNYKFIVSEQPITINSLNAILAEQKFNNLPTPVLVCFISGLLLILVGAWEKVISICVSLWKLLIEGEHFDFFLLVILLVSLNIRYINSIFIKGDTLAYYHHFNFSYNELYYFNQFAFWSPYGTYGQANLIYNLLSLSSMDHLAMFIGKIAGIQNSMLLFQISILGEEFIFLAGMFLLSRRFFTKRSTSFLIGLASIILIVNPTFQSNLTWLRFISWLPIVLYFLLEFFARNNPIYLWVAGISFVFWSLGNTVHQPMWILSLATVFFILLLSKPGLWRCFLSRKWTNWASLGLFLFVAGVYIYLGRYANAHITNLFAGRDPLTGKTSLLPYFSDTNYPLRYFLGSMIFGGQRFYVGLLPLFFFFWAVVRVRNSQFLAILGSTIVLLWATFNGYLSLGTILFLPPYLTQYLLSGFFLVQPLIIIAAGYGWENFWDSNKRWPLILFLLIGSVFLIDTIDFSFGWSPTDKNIKDFLTTPALAFPLIRFFICLIPGIIAACFVKIISWKKSRQVPSDLLPKLFQIGLLCGLFFDLGSFFYAWEMRYWKTILADLPGFQDQYTEDMFVKRMEFLSKRRSIPKYIWQRDAIEQNGTYQTVYNYAQFDPCEIEYTVPNINTDVYQWFLFRVDKHFKKVKTDALTRDIMGCTTEKIRLIPNATFVDSKKMGYNLLRNSQDVRRTVIIQSGNNSLEETQENKIVQHEETVLVTKFSSNQLEANANVNSSPGAWLVYTDGYHSDWHAYVNGKETKIFKANGGFKAVWLPKGRNIVRFEFINLPVFTLYYILAISGALFCITLCGWILWLVVYKSFSSRYNIYPS